MKKSKKLSLLLSAVTLAGVLVAADHIEAPAVSGGVSDITDFYAFQGENTDNLVFTANVQGLLSPTATEDAAFDENTLIEINIDTTGDNVEDLVIQAIPRDGVMYFFGPEAPSVTGLDSTILTDAAIQSSVDITPYDSAAIIAENSGITFFAGPRDDPFFMDFSTYNAVVAGEVPSFNDPGTDTFAGTNVLSVVIEVPKSMIGGSDTINTWVETKARQ